MVKINKLFILIISVAVILIIVGILVLPKFLSLKNNQVACTTEAKICPDGSAVGRTGPNCEFTKCPELKTEVFGSTITIDVGKQIEFNDGLTVTLKQINDSRCKQGVVCIWAGELSPVFTISGGSNNQTKEFTLGTTTKKTTTINGYIFALQSATENTATIIVTKESKSVSTCYVGGCSSEICSAEKGIVSNCIYKAEYACYKTAICARQANGQCGWTQTSELTACLNNSK